MMLLQIAVAVIIIGTAIGLLLGVGVVNLIRWRP